MSVWRNKNYVRVWSGQVVSVIGDGIHRIAILLWTKETTGSNGSVALVAIASTLPILIASPFGGGLADRFDRRRLMIAADVTRVGTSLAIAALLLSGSLSVPLLCAATAIAALGAAVFDPTYAASVTMLVPEDQRATANAMNLANSAAGGLLGPALGGLLVAGTSFGTAVIVDAATFAVSAVLVAMSRIPSPRRAADAGGGLQLREAMHTLWSGRRLRSLAGMGMTLNLATAPLSVLLVALTVDQFGGGAGTLGLLQALTAAGLLLGSAIAAALARARLTLLISLLGVGVCVAAVGAADATFFAAVSMLGIGIGVAVANTCLITTFQRLVVPEQQGRVFGLVGALSQALRPAGLALAAPLIAVAGVRGAYIVCGAGLILSSLGWIRGAGLGDSRSGDDVARAESLTAA